MTTSPVPWIRAKPAAEIARDALTMAARKHTDGCDPCVDAYLELARRNGATEEQITEAMSAPDHQTG